MIDPIHDIGILLPDKPDIIRRCLDFYGDMTDSLEYNLGIKTEELNDINEL